MIMIPKQEFNLHTLNIKHAFGYRMTKEIWFELAFILVYKQIPLFSWISPIGINFAYFAKIKPALLNSSKYFKVKTATGIFKTFDLKVIDPAFVDNLLSTIIIG